MKINWIITIILFSILYIVLYLISTPFTKEEIIEMHCTSTFYTEKSIVECKRNLNKND